jgi:hypothetical protein
VVWFRKAYRGFWFIQGSVYAALRIPNTFPRQKQKTQDGNYASPVFKFTLDGETGKHDSDGSEEFYDANDAKR